MEIARGFLESPSANDEQHRLPFTLASRDTFASLSPPQLYGKVVPDTVKNFVALITGKNAAGVSYQGTEAYRVLDGLNIQV